MISRGFTILRPASCAVARGLTMTLLLGCGQRPTIGLDTAGMGTVPAFTFVVPGQSTRPTIAAFRVDPCVPTGGAPFESAWLTRSPTDDGQPIGRVVYGVPPDGWRSVQGPHPLAPGCYRAAISRAAPLEFDVQPGGNIVQRR